MKTSNILKIYLSVTSVIALIYVFIWLSMCFVRFEFVNPISWILEIPKRDNNYRMNILVGSIFYTLFKWLAIIGIRYENKIKNNKNENK